MRILSVNIYSLTLPFKSDYSIAIRKGRSSRVSVVEVQDPARHIRGYGEALPVWEVTGETTETITDSIREYTRHPLFPWDLEDITQIWRFMDSQPDERFGNAARCAMEMALLDALGKSQHNYITDYFDHRHLTDHVHYGAAVTLGDREKVLNLCRLISEWGLQHLRIKMGTDFEQNRKACEAVRSVFSDRCDIRIDPNQVWDSDLAFRHIPLIKSAGVDIVEEPFSTRSPRFPEFAEEMEGLGVKLMACESAVTLDDVKRIVEAGYYKIINVKLCRSGGFRRAVKMVEYIRRMGLGYQIGCSLGESGLLSAAGRALCLLSGDAMYYDGSYDKFLLKENTTTQPVAFGKRGRAGPLNGPGLGVTVDTRALNRLCAGTPVITVERQ